MTLKRKLARGLKLHEAKAVDQEIVCEDEFTTMCFLFHGIRCTTIADNNTIPPRQYDSWWMHCQGDQLSQIPELHRGGMRGSENGNC